VHGEISGLLERTRRQRDQGLTTGTLDALNQPPAAATQDTVEADRPEPAKVAEGE
jgi:hypothetical protein